MFRLGFLTVWVLVATACQQPFERALERGDQAGREARWPEARDAFADAVKLNPKLAAAHARLGGALWQLGDRPAATSAWQTALELDPRELTAVEGLTRARLASQDAAGAISVSATIDPPTGGLRVARAWALIERGSTADLDAARALLDAARPTDAESPEYSYLQGSWALASRRFSDAQDTFDTLARKHPRSPLGRYGLARVAAAQARATDALLSLQEAKGLAGSSWQPDRVAADPAFAFVAATPEFKALVGK